jgi:hypothetical protein
MIGAEIEGPPPGGVLFRTSRTRGSAIQALGATGSAPQARLRGGLKARNKLCFIPIREDLPQAGLPINPAGAIY